MHISIHGYLVGQIWMPNTECWKPLNYNCDLSRKDTLRDHVLRATNDGDFQSAEIAWGELVIETSKRRGNTYITRRRVWPLDKFPSVADCVRADWDGPTSNEDEYA